MRLKLMPETTSSGRAHQVPTSAIATTGKVYVQNISEEELLISLAK